MPVNLGWDQIALRLALTMVAGIVIGFNRGEHGRPAGMRTTILVCLAASLSMIQANLLMNSVGKARDSFVVLDLMRLPLGILSGMGFIGAGAILRKDNLVLGVTTAATLWFTTVMGLCFGGGQLVLGAIALVLGFVVLWGLKYVEKGMRQDLRALLILIVEQQGPSEEQIRQAIAAGDCAIISWGIGYLHGAREIRCEVERRVRRDETRPPLFVSRFAEDAHIENVQWFPQGLSMDHKPDKHGPKGTPVPITGPQ